MTGNVCDTRCQSFLTAMIEKEEFMRIKWFLKNQQKLLDRLKASERAKLPPTPEPVEKRPSQEIIRLKPLPNWRPMEADGSINLDLMKPIDPKVTTLLYEDNPSSISAENYTRERLKDIPEDRYYYPECSSWIPGWHLKDYPPVSRTKVPKNCIMLREFYHPRVSSLHIDPEWHRPCQKTPNKCNGDIN